MPSIDTKPLPSTLKTGFQTGRSVWYGPEVQRRESEWIFHLQPDELEELRIAAEKLAADTSAGEKFIPLTLLDNLEGNFNLPIITARFFLNHLHHDLGFFVWRGVPVDVWNYRTVAAAFLIIGKCMGNLRQQNAKGHLLGHVKNLGLDSTNPLVRIYQTTERQTFHADSTDVVGLLCLKIAKSGGLSSLVSAGTVYNEILKRNPSYAEELLKPIPTDKRGEVPEGTLPYYNIPVFNDYKGYLSIMYQRPYINSSQRFPEAPRLTQTQIEALDLFDSLVDDPTMNFTMKLLPGDMQFVYNHAMLHDRTAFEDWSEPEKKRHLLRMWIATPDARPLPEVFAERYGSVTIGDRGGITIAGVEPVAPLHP